MKKWLLICIISLITANAFIVFPVNAIVPYQGYTYNYWGEKKDTPPAFIPTRILTSDNFKTKALKNPTDMFISKDGKIAISDTDNDRVLIFDSEFKILHEINQIEYNGEKSSLKSPEGLFIDSDGEFYICDTGNNRIIRYFADMKVRQIYTRPDSPLLEGYSVYSPIRLSVDKSKKLYVICKGINMGILEIDEKGTLDKFIGAPQVFVSPIDYFWKSISTKAQISRMSSYVPTEYNNISIDSEGFLFATNESVTEDQIIAKISSRDRSTNSAPVKRLTLSGEDVLDREGFYPPVGDIKFPVKNQDYSEDSTKGNSRSYLKESEKGPSSIVDVAPSENGIYSILDAKRGRIFTYDYAGNLLFVFAGTGAQVGSFIGPVALCEYKDNYYVLDKVTGSVTEFVRTNYGTSLLSAINSYNQSDYDKSLNEWKQVIARDSNSEIAYLGIGKIYMMRNNYQEAMKYFKLANYRDYYSKALKLYKKDDIGKTSSALIFTLVALAIIAALIIRIKKGVQVIINFGKPKSIKVRGRI